MARPLSNDLRERVVSAIQSGETSRAVAARFGVAVSSVVKWSQRHRATGSVSPDRMGGNRPRVLEPHRAFIAERIGQIPSLTLHKLKAELADRGVSISHDAIWRFLRREGLRFKKNVWPAPSASDFCDPIWSVYANVSGLGTMSRPRWRFARPGPHKTGGDERPFFGQVSRTPIDCQAISHLPPADPISRPRRVSAAGHFYWL